MADAIFIQVLTYLILIKSITCQIQQIQIDSIFLNTKRSSLNVLDYLSNTKNQPEIVGLSLWFKVEDSENIQDKTPIIILTENEGIYNQGNKKYLQKYNKIKIEINNRLKIYLISQGDTSILQFQYNGQEFIEEQMVIYPNKWHLLNIIIENECGILLHSQSQLGERVNSKKFVINCQHLLTPHLDIPIKFKNQVQTKEINFYYSFSNLENNIFSQIMLNQSLLKNICDGSICIRLLKTDVEVLQQEVSSIIISFYLKQKENIQQEISLQFNINSYITLLLNQSIKEQKIIICISNSEYLIDIKEDTLSLITLQIEIIQLSQSTQYTITYYSDQNFQKIVIVNHSNQQIHNQNNLFKIKKPIDKSENFNQFEEIIVFINYRILQNTYFKKTQNNCSIQIIPINQVSHEIDQICLFSQLNKINFTNKTINKYEKYQRNLQSEIKYTHGSYMRSLVRNQYENSQYKSQIFPINTSNFAVIGYFKLSQVIIGTNYLPLITLGTFSQYYNFLNLYIKSDNSVELKYIHDTQNIISSLSFSIGQSMQNLWIAIGLAFDQSLKKSIILISDSTTSQLKSSSQLVTSIPTVGMQLDICITCPIQGENYQHFEGKVSSVKIIYSIDIYAMTNYYFFNENTINKQLILSSAFNFNSYKLNSEYDLGTGFKCNPSYSFFEGVCILQPRCQNIEFEKIPYQQFEVGKYYDSTSNRCQSCNNNCLLCTTSSICISCRNGYVLNNNKCEKCDSTNSCNITCPNNTVFDPINYICVNGFDPYLFQLNPTLVSSRLFFDNDNINISPSLQQNQQVTLCYLYFDNNPMTLYSFLGGSFFSKQTSLKKSWVNLPKGYLKRVQFSVLVYGNALPTQIYVKINQQYGQLNSSYKTIVSNQSICSNSGILTQSVYDVEFYANDYSTNLDLVIGSQVDGWAIRNLNIIIQKCHPTCSTCFTGGDAANCSSCGINQFLNQFLCICQLGYFASYQNTCFSPPCVSCLQCSSIVSNCQACEDITGKCVKCQSGYVVYDGTCKPVSQCTNDDEIFFNYCGIRNEIGLQQFQNNKIVQYSDYWKIYNNDLSIFSCFSLNFLPRLGNKSMNTLKINLPNYFSYHFRININIDVAVIDSVEDADNDHVEIWDGNNLLFQKLYQFHNTDPTSTKICGDPTFFENHYVENMFSNKQDSLLFFKFISFTNEAISNEAFTFRQLDIKYKRCHPLCQSCNEINSSNCLACISNAEMISNTCQCKNGYYFALERNPKVIGDTPGKCLKCSPTCNKCIGPAIQDCTACSEGYSFDSNSICKFNCLEGQYWEYLDQKCHNCNSICRTCVSGDQNSCQDCYPGYQYMVAESTCIPDLQVDCSANVNSFCGGSLVNHNYCIQKGWIIKNQVDCVYCRDFINNQCGGDQSQEVIDSCLQNGYLQITPTQCSSCKNFIGNQCGINQIKEICLQNGWALFKSQCINCSIPYITSSQCACDVSCNTCTKYLNALACTSCNEPLLLYKNQCLSKCPNGSLQNGKNCDICTEKQMANCFNCFKTCIVCSPFKVSDNPNQCTQCSNITRVLINGQCKCKDIEDQRDNFFECSYQNVAVLNAVLSKDSPILTIDFGKLLNIPNGFTASTYSNTLCKVLFTDTFILLLGDTYQCQITEKSIVIIIDSNSDIFQGDLVDLKQNIISFSTSPDILIDTFLKTMIVQEKFIGSSQVIFNDLPVTNSCDDIQITFNRMENTVGRGFHSFSWSITMFSPDNKPQYTLLNNLLKQFNEDQQLNIKISKGIIYPEFNIVIRFDYLLKANIKGFVDFTLLVKTEKKIKLQINSPIIQPFSKKLKGLISIQQSVISCSLSGDVVTKEPIDLKVASTEYPALNFNSKQYQDNEYIINIAPYQIPIQKITINVIASLVSDSNIQSSDSFILDVQQSQLFVKINGGNAFYSYKNQVIITGVLRDYDIQTENEPQGINSSWSCIDQTTQGDCFDLNGAKIVFPNQVNQITLPQLTFNPYTMVKIILTGEKSLNRKQSDSIIILFQEVDLPPFDVDIALLDPQMLTINQDEELFIELQYDSSINSDYLQYSGSLIYEQKTVAQIKFDYFQLRFSIQDYFSQFKRENRQFQIRFNVFNPNYSNPSTFIATYEINFPPSNCKFSVIQSAEIGYSLETKFLLMLDFCEDENQPLQYQFFYYLSSEDYEYEKLNPIQIKRRQITDRQTYNRAEIILPSGKLLLMASVIDGKQAIFNTTRLIEVKLKQYDENGFLQIVQNFLNQSINIPTKEAILQLTILADEILLRKEFKNSVPLNQKKLEIWNELITIQKDLSVISTFTTLIYKGISSIVASGINQSITQNINLLDYLLQGLNEQPQQSTQDPQIEKEILKQKIYDSFLILDSLNNKDITSQSATQIEIIQIKFISLQEKIANQMLLNVLPNENSISFEGSSIKILSYQFTDKYICQYFICDTYSGNNLGDNTNPSIYNIKLLYQSEILYSNDQQYISFMNELKAAHPNLSVVQYPIQTPSISNQYNQPLQNFQNKISIKFKGKEIKDKNGLACLSKNKSNQWTTSDCQSIQDKEAQTYSCVCKYLSPTTLVDTLSIQNNLIIEINEQVIDHFENIKQFYQYAVSWIMIGCTLSLLFLYLKGSILDQKSNISDEQLQELKHFEFQIGLINSNFHTLVKSQSMIPLNLITEGNHDRDLENCDKLHLNARKRSSKRANSTNTDMKSSDNEADKNQKSKLINEEGKQNEKNVEDDDRKENRNEDNSENKKNGNDDLFQSPKSVSSKDYIHDQYNYNSLYVIESRRNSIPMQINFDLFKKARKMSIKKSTIMNIEEQKFNYDLSSITSGQDQQSKVLEKLYILLKSLPLYKKLFFFHNFLSIFYIFNPELPRSVRFLIFYTRIIHSLAVTTIFNKDYSEIDLLIISIINSVAILIIIKILERLFMLKSIFGQFLSRLINGLSLAVYYYLIISIESGYSSNLSNDFISYFALFSIIDIILFTTLSAFFQYTIAINLLKNSQNSTLSRLLYLAIDLNLILIQIK